MPGGWPKNIHGIRELAKKQAATITLGQLMRSTSADPASMIRQGRWLHGTLPVRFARRLDDFLQQPFIVVQNPKFHEVMCKYQETLEAICEFPRIDTAREETAFCSLMIEQLKKHNDIVPMISEGYWEVRQLYPHIQLDAFLDNLFTTRISTRILVENYINMRNPQQGHTGVVMRNLSPLDVIQQKAEVLTKLTRDVCGVCPQVEFRGNLTCTLDYIPRHVSFMVQELLKNALRSTAERHKPNGTVATTARIPPVTIELQKGDVYVIIKISDQGGGMPKRLHKEAWRYGWTTVSEEDHITLDPSTWPGQKLAEKRKELAGFGFGLPLTRLYAQYFGGEVFMQALPGHGTDMYLLLNHLKEGAPSTEMDDPSTSLTVNENFGHSVDNAP
mmetsp:Transcript_105400/g.297838  ORF Transcript_105400/g.297838 Transcript_105400/m.297838 type:complete len:388 (+) Transcript_105400:39-1202(+)